VGLSGTPIENRPDEFYGIVDFINKNIFPNRWAYRQRYTNPTHNGFGWDFSGAANLKELHEIITGTVMIRHKKMEVLDDLPEKTRTAIPIDIDQKHRSEYQAAEQDIIGWIKTHEGTAAAKTAMKAEALVRFEKLKQIAVKGKMKEALKWVDSFAESGEKLCIFAIHKEVISMVMDHIQTKYGKSSVVKIDGQISKTKRQFAIDTFQTDPICKFFVGSVDAAGIGLTLTAASNTLGLELPWTPGKQDQFEDRIHRIGQKNASNIWYLLGNDTIEITIAELLDSKREVLTAVMDGEEVKSEDLLSDLLDKYWEKK
jgi:SWI/SNF-related matrix-associated actin-dependent regulator 1 of chromatin subfamily A